MGSALSLFSFPRQSRIVSAEEYSAAKKKGCRLATRFFVLYIAPAALGRSRLGVIASRRVGNAVARCRAKRLVREAFRTNRPYFPVALDIVAVVKAGVELGGFRDIEADFVKGIRLAAGRLPRG